MSDSIYRTKREQWQLTFSLHKNSLAFIFKVAFPILSERIFMQEKVKGKKKKNPDQIILFNWKHFILAHQFIQPFWQSCYFAGVQKRTAWDIWNLRLLIPYLLEISSQHFH